jgi:lysophospholipase L1-like esterase
MRTVLFIILFITTIVQAQDPHRFADEVANVQKKYDTLWDASKETIVFTGSSSIRIWKNLKQSFPNHQIVNTGFGGSQASDLLAYSEELILRFKPKTVFIYEGDNDIFAKKKTKEIIYNTLEVIAKIKEQNTETLIILIAAKPSIARWHLKRSYKRLNRKLKRLAKKDTKIQFANVWRPMLDGKNVKTDIFVEDGLHMNPKGYAIWYDVIKSHID